MDAISFKKTLIQLEVKETALILTASVIIPFVVHLIPSFTGIPVGAMLLAMFYAPFIAIILFRPHVAIVTGLLSPILNSLLTGYPVPEKIVLLTVELVLFSVILYLIQRRWRHFWGAAALAYLATVLTVTSVLGSIDFFVSIIVSSLPGIAILFLINIFLLRLSPK